MNLREMRLAQKLTQREVAAACGVNQSAVSGWENGTRLPSSKRLCKLAEFYGCTVDEILQPDKEEAAQ